MSANFNLAALPATQGVAVRQIGALLRHRQGLVAAIAASVLAGAGLELIPALIIQRLIDEYLTVGQAAGLWQLALLYFLATGGVQIFSLATQYLTALAAQGVLRDLRVRLFAHLQQLPMPYFDQTPLGDLISRVTSDVDTLDTLFSTGVASLLADLVRLFSVVFAMGVLSPQLSLIAVVVLVPLVWVTRAFQHRVRDAERGNRQAIGRLSTHLREALTGSEVIRAFQRETTFAHRFRLALCDALAAYNRATVYASVYTPLMAIVSAAVVALLIWVGAGNSLAGSGLSLGTLTAFVLLFRRFFTPIISLGEEWQTVQSALSGTERIFQVLNLPVDAGTRPAAQRTTVAAADGVHGQVVSRPAAPCQDLRTLQVAARLADNLPVHTADGLELRAVTVGYQSDRPVLHRLSMQVRIGEHVALVGRTGAGKTSSLHLFAGLLAPWSGEVWVAGRDPCSLPDGDRRRLVGVVSQVVQLFGGSVWENLTLGDTSLGQAEIERAATLSGADVFIRALPQGYQTRLGEGGSADLSAGQRQLLALTRALVWDPPVLLLDEATALIDSATDAAFRSALRSGRRRAVLSIAHRLATARAADRVIVLEAGRVVEEGPPDALLQRGGRFAAWLELEAAGWDWHEVPLVATQSGANGDRP